MPAARTYSYLQLERLYVQNGGNPLLAPIMAAIAIAESRGKSNARHVNTDGSVDQGLWQINTSNSKLYSGKDIYDPNVNAQVAVQLAEHSKGKLANWTTYTSGAYKKYLSRNMSGHRKPAASLLGKRFGVFSQGNYAGTDQGVDFRGAGPIPALGSGVVTDVGRSSIIEGGSFPYVIYQLTSGPYRGHYVYVAENFLPTVKKGTRVRLGQSVGRALGTFPYIEVGFNKTATGWNPVAPLNPNPHSPKPAGNAMWSYIQGLTGLQAPVTTAGTAGGPGGGLSSLNFNPFTSSFWNPSQIVQGAKTTIGAAADATGIPGAIKDVGHWIIDAGAIVGGGFIFIMGFVLIAADVGLSSRAGKVVAAVPAGRYIAKGARTRNRGSGSAGTNQRREERAEERHRETVATQRARRRYIHAQTAHTRRKVKRAGEQKAETKKAYVQGRTDEASPTMARIRRNRQNKE